MTRKRLSLGQRTDLERLQKRLTEDAQHVRLVRQGHRTLTSLAELHARLTNSRALIIKLMGETDDRA